MLNIFGPLNSMFWQKHVCYIYIQTIICGASNSFSYIKMLIFVPLNSMFWQNIIISKQLFMVEANSFSYIKMLSSLKKYISHIKMLSSLKKYINDENRGVIDAQS